MEEAVNRPVLFVLKDSPYGSERVFNGLRLADAVAKRGGDAGPDLPHGDAVLAAMAQPKLPNGYYHLDRMIAAAGRRGPTSVAARAAWMGVESPTTC
jgi:uncharacterized protein involved in oxidation of intracellular sulfur